MIRGVLLDLSGVLYVGEKVVPGAVEALARLREAHLPVRFVTNVTRKPFARILESITSLGFDISGDELLTAPRAARRYLEAHGLHPYLLVHPALEEEFADLAGAAPNAVLIGDAGSGFTYENLNRAFRLLMEDAPLLAMGNNRYFREDDGLSLDIGPFVAALEYATDTRAVILGKPSADFFRVAVDALGCRMQEAVMVGDDALADVDGALAAGLGGILVKTGKYRDGDEDRITHPDSVLVSDIAAAVEHILAAA